MQGKYVNTHTEFGSSLIGSWSLATWRATSVLTLSMIMQSSTFVHLKFAHGLNAFKLPDDLIGLLMCFHHLNVNALFFFFSLQIFVVSQAEPRLPLQLDDAVRPDAEGEEVRGHGWQSFFFFFWIMIFTHVLGYFYYWLTSMTNLSVFNSTQLQKSH